MRIAQHTLQVSTNLGIHLHSLMAQLRECIEASGIRNGFVIVTSRHTTTAITINENEARLLEDVKRFFAKLAPANEPYLHNDIHLRDCPPDEPENAHSHLLAMLLGSSEAIPLVEGALALGQWQSVMLVELDGPRERAVSVQIYGE